MAAIHWLITCIVFVVQLPHDTSNQPSRRQIPTSTMRPLSYPLPSHSSPSIYKLPSDPMTTRLLSRFIITIKVRSSQHQQIFQRPARTSHPFTPLKTTKHKDYTQLVTKTRLSMDTADGTTMGSSTLWCIVLCRLSTKKVAWSVDFEFWCVVKLKGVFCTRCAEQNCCELLVWALFKVAP